MGKKHYVVKKTKLVLFLRNIGAATSEMDGSRSVVRSSLHDEERRLGLRCSAVGDLHARREPVPIGSC